MIALLFAALALIPNAHAVVIAFPPGSVDVKLELQGDDCGEQWALICVTSLERQRAYLLTITDPRRFVSECYRVLLRRGVWKPDDAGLTYYSAALENGTMTREEIIAAFVSSAEYRELHQ